MKLTHNNFSDFNVEAEEAILGAILLNPEAIVTAASSLHPESFSVQSHRTIYRAALSLHQEGKPTDLMMMLTFLRDKGQLSDIGGQSKLACLVEQTVSAANIDQYAELVTEKYYLRLQRGIGADMAAGKLSLEEAKAALDKIFQSRSRKSPAEQLRDRLSNAAQLDGSLRAATVTELASREGQSVHNIEKIIKALELEQELEEETILAKDSLKRLLNTKRTHLKPQDYFEPWFADILQRTANAMPTAVEFFLTTLLPAAASCIGTSSRIVIKPNAKYTQPAIIWSAVIGRTGSLKTPSQRIILDPLLEIEINSATRYKQELDEWEEEKEARKANPEKFKEPLGPRPKRKRFVIKDATLETLQRIHADNPRGLLYYRDELAGGAKSRNQYRGGFGADYEAELEQFNGTGILYDRGDTQVCLDRTSISRTGGYQFEVAQQMLDEAGDYSGYNARWLLCGVEPPKAYIDLFNDADEDTGIFEALSYLYNGLLGLPTQDYLLSDGAKALFQAYQHCSIDECHNEFSPGLQAVYPKNQSYAARLALVLHLSNAVLRREQPASTISAETMRQAIDLCGFYLWQYRSLYLQNHPEGLDGMALKIHHYAQRVGKVSASRVKAGVSVAKKKVVDSIRACFQSLAVGGWGKIEGEGAEMVYIPNELPNSPPMPVAIKEPINFVNSSIATPEPVPEQAIALVDNQHQSKPGLSTQMAQRMLSVVSQVFSPKPSPDEPVPKPNTEVADVESVGIEAQKPFPKVGDFVVSTWKFIQKNGQPQKQQVVRISDKGEARTDKGFNISRTAWERGDFVPCY